MELIPLECEEGKFYACFVEKGSLALERIKTHGVPMTDTDWEIEKAHKDDPHKQIFIPKGDDLYPVVTETLKEFIEQNGLLGLTFRQI